MDNTDAVFLDNRYGKELILFTSPEDLRELANQLESLKDKTALTRQIGDLPGKISIHVETEAGTLSPVKFSISYNVNN